MNDSNKILILFTEEFPFGSGETFIESEISYLSEHFRVVYIVTKDSFSNIERPVPENILS